ncbi:MAG: Omp28-related outer membrane protein [candidate division Zixibacteria bacterium]|nr:Omp28-related outer membrane protein [candidate division Zixibacteria bacterium]
MVLDQLIEDNFDNFLVIRWHRGAPSPNDPFYNWNPEPVNTRASYYGANYNPRLFLDGIMDCKNDETEWQDSLNLRLPVESPLNMVVSGNWEEGTREVDVNLRIDVVGNVQQSNTHLYVGVIESDIYFEAPNGELWHNQVFRELLTANDGDPVTLVQDNSYSYGYNFTLDTEYTAENTEIFAFVQHKPSKEIYQGAKAWITQLMPGDPIVSVDMVPDDDPIIVPQGGSFSFTGILANNTAVSQVVDVWIMLDVPGYGIYGPLQRFNNVPLNGYQFLTAPGVNQPIPGYAPEGDYDYIAYTGDYPDDAIDSASFPFTVVSGRNSSNDGWETEDWFNTNSKSEDISVKSSAYPNPFNAQTSIEYELPISSEIRLSIYNILGQEVATLVDATQNAGKHKVVWNASEFSSGIYYYKLSNNDSAEFRRITLLK